MTAPLALAFRIDPADAARLPRLACLKGKLGRATARATRLTAWDLAVGTLGERSLTLWTEETGRRRLLRAELAGPRLAGAECPETWEVLAPHEVPDLTLFTDPRLQSFLDGLDGMPLLPRFRADLKRTRRRVAWEEGTDLDLVLEQGDLIAAPRNQPVGRLVLEASPASAAALFSLARDLLAELPLALELRSLAERGRDLAAHRPPPWMRRRPSDLTAASTVEDSLVSMVRQGLDHVLANQPCVLESHDPEGIHQMRVGLRRTRSALRLFRKLLPPDQYEWLTGEVRWITAQLGPARDMDVFEDELLGPVLAGAPDGDVFKSLVARIRRERARRRRAALKAIESARWSRFVLEAGTWLTRRPWRVAWGPDLPEGLLRPVIDLAARQLARRHKQVHRDAHRFHELSPPERHQLRIDLKKLRYALDFFGPLYPEQRVTRYLERLAGLQDGLGYLNDVTVARQLIDSLCAGATGQTLARCLLAGGLVLGWHAHAAAATEENLKADLATFLRAKPFWKAP